MAKPEDEVLDQYRTTNDWLRSKVKEAHLDITKLNGDIRNSEVWRRLYAVAALIGWSALVVFLAFGDRVCSGS